jgi:predicted adenine nucleotide alpha hydrolase (AANH) superfamily ATPase
LSSGEILDYLTDLDTKISDIMKRQIEKWKSADKEYLVAVAIGDFRKAQGLENMFRLCAREAVYEGMVYV